jgi:hypothetical protein
MPGLVPGIDVLKHRQFKNVDGRDKPGHDDSSPPVVPAQAGTHIPCRYF